jgi:hypothetical protein
VAGGWCVNQRHVHTRCTLMLGREACGIDQSLPMLPPTF